MKKKADGTIDYKKERRGPKEKIPAEVKKNLLTI